MSRSAPGRSSTTTTTTRSHGGQRPGGLDRIGEADPAVTADDHHVGDAAVEELGQVAATLLGPFGAVPGPQAERGLEVLAALADTGDLGHRNLAPRTG